MKKLFKTALTSIMALILLGSSPIPAKADSGAPGEINLELGDEGATSWKISNICPGDSGTKIVTLHNAGSLDGFVIIWISNILEKDYGGDGAWLDDYVLFHISSSGRLNTNLSLPVTIHKLPQDATATGSPNYLRIDSLRAGETITLIWHWHFLAEAGNKAQGDSFSFSINYKLEGIPPPSEGYWEPPAGTTHLLTPSILPKPQPKPPKPTPPAPSEPEPVPPVPPAPSVTPTPPVEENNWPLIGGIIAGVLIVSAVCYGYFLTRRRIRKRKAR